MNALEIAERLEAIAKSPAVVEGDGSWCKDFDDEDAAIVREAARELRRLAALESDGILSQRPRRLGDIALDPPN